MINRFNLRIETSIKGAVDIAEYKFRVMIPFVSLKEYLWV